MTARRSISSFPLSFLHNSTEPLPTHRLKHRASMNFNSSVISIVCPGNKSAFTLRLTFVGIESGSWRTKYMGRPTVNAPRTGHPFPQSHFRVGPTRPLEVPCRLNSRPSLNLGADFAAIGMVVGNKSNVCEACTVSYSQEFSTIYLENTTVASVMEKPWVYMRRESGNCSIGLDKAVKRISVPLPHDRQYHTGCALFTSFL